MSTPRRIALIGFGEVGVTLADDLATHEVILAAWDTKFVDPASSPSTAIRTRAVRPAVSGTDAVAGASLIVSAVTAAQTEAAAQACATAIARDLFYLDLNSASPGAKTRAAQIVNDAGGRYVEAAVMSPIHPKRSAVPLLLGGPHAEAFLPLGHSLGFVSAQLFSESYGVAAATKLCRSVVVKGVEALFAESMLAARHYGVEGTVLSSLGNLFPGLDAPEFVRYMISRTLEHGARRAEEMREAARTVQEAGLEPWMAEAIALRQDWGARFAAALDHKDLREMLDGIRAELDEQRPAGAQSPAAASR